MDQSWKWIENEMEAIIFLFCLTVSCSVYNCELDFGGIICKSFRSYNHTYSGCVRFLGWGKRGTNSGKGGAGRQWKSTVIVFHISLPVGARGAWWMFLSGFVLVLRSLTKTIITTTITTSSATTAANMTMTIITTVTTTTTTTTTITFSIGTTINHAPSPSHNWFLPSPITVQNGGNSQVVTMDHPPPGMGGASHHSSTKPPKFTTPSHRS